MQLIMIKHVRRYPKYGQYILLCMFQTVAFQFGKINFCESSFAKKLNMKASLSSAGMDFRKLMSFFLISDLTSSNKWSKRSGDMLKYLQKKAKHND